MLAILLATAIFSGGSFAENRNGSVWGGYFNPYLFNIDQPYTVMRSTGTSSSPQTTKDTVNLISTAPAVTDVILNYSLRPLAPAFTITRTCGDGHATPAGSSPFVWTYASSGTAFLVLTNPGFSSTNHIILSSTTSGSTTLFDHFVSGSAADNGALNIDNLIAGKDASTKPIFTTQDHSNAIYVRNPACWAYSLNLTCISPWNSYEGPRRAGTLIAADIVLFANHYSIPAGHTIRFITGSNTVVERSITATTWVTGDIAIGKLDSDVPAGIIPAKVLPAAFAPKLCFPTQSGRAWNEPVLCLDQEEKALLTEIDYINGVYSIQMKYPTTNQRLIFSEDLITGDSGNPAFLVINNELVVITTWTTGGAGSGSFLPPANSLINAAMTVLGSSHQLNTIDLSAFPSYE